MLYQLPDGNWIDPATVTGIRYEPGKPQPHGSSLFSPSRLWVDRKDGEPVCAATGLSPQDAAKVRDSLAARVNAPAEAAVLAERERCANLAELEPTPLGVPEADTIRNVIATAIRSGVGVTP